MRQLVIRCLVAVFALAALDAPADPSAALNVPRPKIGWVKMQARSHAPDELKAFIDGLRAQGYVPGRNLDIEERYADGDASRLQQLVTDLVAAGVRVIVATSQPVLDAAADATVLVPIVARMSDNPVSFGMAQSLAAPGGNVTGVLSSLEEMPAVRLDKLLLAVPDLRKVGALLTLEHADTGYWLTQARAAAAKKGLDFYVMNVRQQADLAGAFATARDNGVNGLLTFRSPVIATSDALIAELSNKHQLPGIFETRDFVESGAFMSYGPNAKGVFYTLAGYVDRILKGEAPGAIAIGNPRVLELAINLKAAKVLGVTVPSEVIAGADLVVE